MINLCTKYREERKENVQYYDKCVHFGERITIIFSHPSTKLFGMQ